MQMREKEGKSRNTVFFQWFEAPEGRKVGSLKRRVRSQLARWEMKNCTPLWRAAHFEVKMHKTPQLRTTFGSEMLKKCTPFWREAHFEVKMYKTPQLRTTFGSCVVEKVHAVVARSTFWSQHVKNTRGSDHFWTLRCRSARQVQGIVDLVKSEQNVELCRIFSYNHHYTTLHYVYTPIHYTTLQLHLHYIPLHYTPLHSTTLHYTTLHSTTQHCTTLTTTTTTTTTTILHLHYATLHYTNYTNYTTLR